MVFDPGGENDFDRTARDNGVPDECEPDCNNNRNPDSTDVSGGGSDDCNGNGTLGRRARPRGRRGAVLRRNVGQLRRGVDARSGKDSHHALPLTG